MGFASAELVQQEQGIALIDIGLMMIAAVIAALAGFADMWGAIAKDFANITEPGAFAAFVQVLMIDLVLAGDNAIVVGALAAGLPAAQRKKVIVIGAVSYTHLRAHETPEHLVCR